jgi:hypothetical protein
MQDGPCPARAVAELRPAPSIRIEEADAPLLAPLSSGREMAATGMRDESRPIWPG